MTTNLFKKAIFALFFLSNPPGNLITIIINSKEGMRNVDYKNIPNCLRKYRKARGLKQKDVVKILNLKNTGMISRWEKGVCLPSLINAFKLAGLYCVLGDALFFPLIRQIKKKIMERQNEIMRHRHG